MTVRLGQINRASPGPTDDLCVTSRVGTFEHAYADSPRGLIMSNLGPSHFGSLTETHMIVSSNTPYFVFSNLPVSLGGGSQERLMMPSAVWYTHCGVAEHESALTVRTGTTVNWTFPTSDSSKAHFFRYVDPWPLGHNLLQPVTSGGDTIGLGFVNDNIQDLYVASAFIEFTAHVLVDIPSPPAVIEVSIMSYDSDLTTTNTLATSRYEIQSSPWEETFHVMTIARIPQGNGSYVFAQLRAVTGGLVSYSIIDKYYAANGPGFRVAASLHAWGCLADRR